MTLKMTSVGRKRKWAAVAISLLLLLTGLFSGCSNAPKDIDLKKLSEDLQTQIAFEDELVEIEDSVLDNFYTFTDKDAVESYVIYKSASNATAEEIALFKVKDSSQVDAVKQSVETRVTDLHDRFESYVPAEIFKIDNAVIKTSGNYVLLVITTEFEKAEEIIDSYLK